MATASTRLGSSTAKALAKALHAQAKSHYRRLYEGGRRTPEGSRFSTKPQDSDDDVYTAHRGGGQYSSGGEKD